MTPYEELERHFERLSQLSDITGMLHWDMEAMMPAGGAEARAAQLATLKVMAHEILTDPSLGDLLEAPSDGLDPWQAANLREMRWRWTHATAVDSDLIAALSKASSNCEMIWRQAKQENDFACVLAPAEELLSLVRRVAEAKGEKLGCAPYDALIDQWEPQSRAQAIDPVFDDLAAFLPAFLGEVLEHQGSRPAPLPLAGPFPEKVQRALCAELMKTIGFDFEHGRLDVSHHPFCGGVPEDVRITTRYTDEDFMPALMAVAHETGHALYDQGLPRKWRHQPVGQARGMSVHESQSLLIEMQACRSREFIEFAAPLLREAFDGKGKAWEADNIYRLCIRVRPGLIRVDADEVTYPAHVILRYRLEKVIIGGDLAFKDLPGAWNDGMKELLGLAPPNDGEGCLQDIHWYAGVWGYFPTYTLGAMAAAQLFDAAESADPDIRAGLAQGDFTKLIDWLRENVHFKGSLLSTRELMAAATGRPLDPEVFKQHLKHRYLS